MAKMLSRPERVNLLFVMIARESKRFFLNIGVSRRGIRESRMTKARLELAQSRIKRKRGTETSSSDVTN